MYYCASINGIYHNTHRIFLSENENAGKVTFVIISQLTIKYHCG